jgi:hypothetical protein
LSVQLGGVVTDLTFRLRSWQRQRAKIQSDPLAFDARVDPHSRELGFYHCFAAEDGETLAWLRSPAYVIEVEKAHPIDACHLAVAQFHAYLATGSADARDGFFRQLDAILALGTHDERGFVIAHDHAIEGYPPHATGWVNAMVQGWVAALCARAHQAGGGSRYEQIARAALHVFRRPVEQGGVRSRERLGGVFFEKYALVGQSRHVLNGFMSSLMSLWDVARALDDAEARALFDDGVATLSDRVLDTYDLGYSSRYDQEQAAATPNSVFYTWVHARQLAALGRITGREGLAARSVRWRTYTTSWLCQLRTTVDTLQYRVSQMPAYVERVSRDSRSRRTS